jgi:3',5'-cyclic AMP phosphodiesterase CpdA
MSSSGFAFANPTYTADNFFTYSAGDIEADAGIQELQETEPIPAPQLDPPVMDLSVVLPADTIAQIQAAGQLVFHSVGDTGGIVKPDAQLAVADAMCADLGNLTYATGLPAFFYHLGDVVYYFGQQQYYPEQFYDPYRNYNAPIFAIPGNHDGVLYSEEPVSYSLQPFVENFCAASPVAAVPSFARTTMTQPGCYFVLTAPFTRFIGLYSNTGEEMGVIEDDSTIGQDQLTFLEQQLAAALAARNAANAAPEALILAVHHPPFTGSSQHFPSAAMLADIDGCCEQAGIWPDLVLSGHSHLYERYTRTMAADGRQIAYVVAGNGGYYNLSTMKMNVAGVKPQAGQHSEPDGQGNTISLDQYNETDFGFLRITVSPSEIIVVSLGVDPNVAAGTAPAVIDSFIVNLAAHTVTTGSATTTSVTRPVKKNLPVRSTQPAGSGSGKTHTPVTHRGKSKSSGTHTKSTHAGASHAGSSKSAAKAGKAKTSKRRA